MDFAVAAVAIFFFLYSHWASVNREFTLFSEIVTLHGHIAGCERQARSPGAGA